MTLSRKAKFRLGKLIEHMGSLPKSAAKHFDMGTWFAHEGDDHDHGLNGKELEASDLHACGTTACAVGYASTLPYFRRLGLRVKVSNFGSQVIVNGEEDTMFNQVCALFDLSYDDATRLFGADRNDASPQSWARRARRFLDARS